MERFFSSVLGGGGLGSLVELGRPWNGILSGLLAVLGIALGGGGLFIPSAIIFVLFTISYMAGSTVNDLYDESVDRYNMPYRPLQENRIGRVGAWRFSVSLHIIALLMALMISVNVFMILVVFFLFSFAYSVPPLHMCRRGIVSQLGLGFTLVTLPFYTGIVYATNSFFLPVEIMFFLVGTFFMFVFVMLLKDFKDIYGDNMENKRTAVLVFGEKRTRVLSIAGTIVAFIFSLWAFSLLNHIGVIIISAFIILLALLVFAEYKVLRMPEEAFGAARLLMFVSVLAFIVVLFL